MKNPTTKITFFLLSIFTTIIHTPIHTMEIEVEKKEDKKKEENNCLICLDPLQDKPVQALECMHTFHAECLGEMIEKSHQHRCPQCRHEIADNALKNRIKSTYNRIKTEKRQQNPECQLCGEEIASDQESQNVYNAGIRIGKVHTECQKKMVEEVKKTIIPANKQKIKMILDNLKKIDQAEDKLKKDLGQFNTEFYQKNILTRLPYYMVGDSKEKEIHQKIKKIKKTRAKVIQTCHICSQPAAITVKVRCQHCNHEHFFGTHKECLENIMGENQECPVCGTGNGENNANNTNVEENNDSSFLFDIKNFFIQKTNNAIKLCIVPIVVASIVGLFLVNKNNSQTATPDIN